MSPLRAAVLLAILSGAGDARAFVRTTTDDGQPLFWDSPIVSYVVNPARPGPPEGPRESLTCAPGDGRDPLLDAVRAGFEGWHQPCSHLRLMLAGVTEDIRVAQIDMEQNLVVFREGFCSARDEVRADPCWSSDVDCGNIYNCFENPGGDLSTLALTSVLFRPSTGRIVKADIEMVGWDGALEGTTLPDSGPLHGWYFTCVDRAAAPNGKCVRYGQEACYHVDLQNTVTHEVGHLIGLRHVCDGGSLSDADLPACRPSDQATTMFPFSGPSDFEKRSLDADDVAGVCAAYPESDGGCGCGSGGPPGLVELAALLALAALRPWRRRAR